MTLRFGTDGVRGIAGIDLTTGFAHSLGCAAARVLGGDEVLLGRDTRRSGPEMQAALAAGFAAGGVPARDLGVVPTPGVAYLSARHGVPAAMVSASHNPWTDNGIKLFAAGGLKLSDDEQARIEEAMRQAVDGAVPEVHGMASSDRRPVDAYRTHLVTAVLEGRRLDGLRVVLDCANGAASALGPEVFEALGAEVTTIHHRPDGTNINAGCGSTHPADLQRLVTTLGADLGLAFDGDADRVLAVDAAGELVDGDQLIAVCAIDRRLRARLVDDTVVVTVMTNLGFRRGMAAHGIRVVDTEVGDRHVLVALEEHGWTLGGEQSGHVIFRDLATTGDGVLTGLVVADLLGRTGRPLAELAGEAMTRLPQVLRNVVVAGRPAEVAEVLAAPIAATEAELGTLGRVLVRPSGTEPLVRVMVEAPAADQAARVAAALVAAVEEAYGASPEGRR
ncbi:phosphoglucosamine mutase [soil metagenome]